MCRLSLVIFLIIITLVFPLPDFAQTWESVNISGIYFQPLQKTKYGLMAGEMDFRSRPEIYNGVYLSKDFGNNWTRIGLEDRGITAIASYNDTVIAGTYYAIGGMSGVFIYDYSQNKWNHLNLNYSIQSLAINENTIFAGTISHGLWVSNDKGLTWEQKIGTGLFGPDITAIGVRSPYVFVGASLKNYLSSNDGETFSEINDLNNKTINKVVIEEDFLGVSTNTNDGIYVSNDNGHSWNKSEAFGTTKVGGFVYQDNCLFAGKPSLTSYNIYKSCNKGANWIDLGVVSNDKSTYVYDTQLLFSEPNIVITSLNGYGLKQLKLENLFEKDTFLSKPWIDENINIPIVDFITAYFDHEYPLLGSGVNEPVETRNTTVNFFGERKEEPYLYYSSHNGNDFKLPYGTPILAAAGGTASYKYCTDCGNTITIDHGNGYQTQYMHLQNEGLLTKSSNGIAVQKGQPIGNVGMTGRTSGPHLHFLVNKDTNNNGIFGDDYPFGVTDPFGWLTNTLVEPWSLYSTSSGSGKPSKYLWDFSLDNKVGILSSEDSLSIEENALTVEFPVQDNPTPATVLVRNYTRPTGLTFQNLFYIPTTSRQIEMRNYFNQKVMQLMPAATITYKLLDILPDFVDWDTLGIYFWDEVQKLWLEIPSVLNEQTKIISAAIDHLSNFAVFGKIREINQIVTTIELLGNQVNGWYTAPPTLIFSVNDPNAQTFYSFDAGLSWIKYESPVIYPLEGITIIQYKSINNLIEEPIKQTILKVRPKTGWTDTVVIRNNSFNTSLIQ